MKICYINPTNNIRRPIAEMINILAKENKKVGIMYPLSDKCPTKNWIANDAINKEKIKKHPIKSFYIKSLRYSFPNIFSLIKKTEEIFKKYDKIHIWEYYYPISIIPILYALLTNQRKKIILTTDGFVGYSYKPKKPKWLIPAFKLYTNLFARFLFKIPKKITTYGNSMIPFAKKAGISKNKLKVISTGIHLKRFQEVNQKKLQKLKQEFNIKDEMIILFVGMLTERKGIKKVIKISNRLIKENHNIKTLIVGDSHGKNRYKNLIPKELQSKIIFTGGRKDITEFMKISNILLLPSKGEGLPGVVMEAMASGLPVVATNEGCTPDLIEKEEEGFLVDIGSDYYNKVKELINNKELREKFSNNSLKKIEKFSWEKVINKYKDLYETN